MQWVSGGWEVEVVQAGRESGRGEKEGGGEGE